MSYTKITPVEITPATIDAWVDVDVSAYVPAGATGVALHFVDTATAAETVGARKNGSTDNRIGVIGFSQHCWGSIGIDGSRILELNVGSITTIDVYLVGYYLSESVFFTNAPDKSLTTTSAWTDIDISSNTGTDTAIQAIFEIKSSGLTAYACGLRKNGSTDNRINTVLFHHCFGATIGVDEAEICEGYIGSIAVDFFLVGYIKSDVVSLTNGTDLSLGSIGSYIDLAALPSGATAGWIEVVATTAYLYALRENGSAENIYYKNKHCWALVGCDSSLLIEGKIENVGLDFFLVGYPTAAAAEGQPTWKRFGGIPFMRQPRGVW